MNATGGRRSRLYVIAAVIGCVLGLAGLGGFLFRAVDAVRKGHGLDYYLSYSGFEFNAIGALITFAVIPIALLLAWGISMWHRWREARLLDELRQHRRSGGGRER